MPASSLPPGLVVFVKRDCPTCVMLESVLGDVQRGGILVAGGLRCRAIRPVEAGTEASS